MAVRVRVYTWPPTCGMGTLSGRTVGYIFDPVWHGIEGIDLTLWFVEKPTLQFYGFSPQTPNGMATQSAHAIWGGQTNGC